ncbi:MAG: head-tail connector protein [Beijerinckiaceae bacterium]|nr:head-tail connector protein [Beijerinckiaceae bacterium]
MVVTVNELKTHLRLETTDEDTLLEETIGAATKHIENVMGLAFDDIVGGTPEPLKQAVKMLSAHWYEARGVACTETMRPFPISVQEILNEYREFNFE